MTNVHGRELESATKELESNGFTVTSVETRSKKGVNGDQKRVVRQRQTGENSVELVYAVFKTTVDGEMA